MLLYGEGHLYFSYWMESPKGEKMAKKENSHAAKNINADKFGDIARYAFIFIAIFALFGYLNTVLNQIWSSLDTPMIILSAVIFSTVVFILLKAKYPFTWGWLNK